VKVISTVEQVRGLRPTTTRALITSTAAVTEVIAVDVLYVYLFERKFGGILQHISIVLYCFVYPLHTSCMIRIFGDL